MTVAKLGVLAALLLLGTGCRSVLNTDEYATTERFEECGPGQVRDGETCVPVGVRTCGTGFGRTEQGSCEPRFELAPCEGANYLRPGLASCSPISSTCADGDFGTLTDQVGTKVVYVGPSGSRFPAAYASAETIAAALADGATTIMLSRGSHAGGVVIDRATRIIGACPDQTVIVSPAGQPALRVGLGADGSSFEEFAVTGDGSGIAVSGVERVTLRNLRIFDVQGPGIMVDDAAGWKPTNDQYKTTFGTIERVLVKRARDIGIGAYGATLELRDVQVTETLPVREGERAHGLVARPSPQFTLEQNLAVEKARRPGVLTVTRSLIERSRGAAVLVEGGTVKIESSLIHGVQPDLARHGRGIDVRAHTPGRVPSKLELRQSIVEDAWDVGVRIWNADSALIEDSVVRNTGAAMTGRCLGNAVRARYDLVRDSDLDARLTISHSSFEGSRQAGILIEGGTASIADSIVRDTLAEPCRNDFGDGVAVHASPTGRSRTRITRTRIENAARAAIASYDSDTSADAVVARCTRAGLAANDGKLAAPEAYCGCSGRLRRCVPEEAASPSLYGGKGCQANDDTVCYRGCSGSVGELQSRLFEATVWSYDHDEIASVVSDENGCYEVEGIPPNERVMLSIVHDEHVAGLGMMKPLASDATEAHRAELLKSGLMSLGVALFGTKPDFRNIFVSLTRYCDSPKRGSEQNSNVCVGIPGVTAKLSPGPSSAPIYFSESNIPFRELTATMGADVVFTDLAPGQHEVTGVGPGGKSLQCEPDAVGLGWVEAPNRVRMVAEEGFTMIGAELNCAVGP